MPNYTIRVATLDDVPTLVRHHQAVFVDMGIQGEHIAMNEQFAKWVTQAIANESYFGWLVETESHEVVAGGSLFLLPWPPSPTDLNWQRGYVFDVYTRPDHRLAGLARRVMGEIHQWAKQRGLKTIGLHPSREGRALYESLGYLPASEMLLSLK